MLSQEDLIMIKGKRSKRPRPVSPLALTMATTTTSSCSTPDHAISPTSPSDCADEEEEDMANCLILLAKGHDHERQTIRPSSLPSTPAHEVYQCKTCNKSFPSFQALGGHRASHTKPNNKPTTTLEEKTQRWFSNQREDDRSKGVDRNNTTLSLQISNRVAMGHQNKKSRVHECAVCGAEFGSGQALGGHMRRHRPMPRIPSSYSDDGESQESKKPRNLLPLDLNLPAPADDHDHQHHRESKFPFAPKEQVIVFSNSPLVDCLY